MKNPIMLIIISLLSLQFLCMPNMSNAQSYASKTCKTGWSSTPITIKFPFFLKGSQPESCGLPGFELYCDDKLGTLLELPHAGNFTVDSIGYDDYSREIQLSDPNKCFVQKMLLLNLTNTPFKPSTPSFIFSLYNCSGNEDIYGDFSFSGFYKTYYKKISCLSGSSYTIAAGYGSGSTAYDSRCKFVKIVSAPTRYKDIFELDSYWPSIHLTWDDLKCKSSDSTHSSSRAWIGGVLITVLLLIIIIYGYCICRATRSRRNATAPIVTSTNTNLTNSHRQTHDGPGLDQITIDSYPIVVIGESGHLIKPDNDKCPICLSDYSPGDILKILPECLHRFHADCIDLWLSSKPTCPICRTSPQSNSLAC